MWSILLLCSCSIISSVIMLVDFLVGLTKDSVKSVSLIMITDCFCFNFARTSNMTLNIGTPTMVKIKYLLFWFLMVPSLSPTALVKLLMTRTPLKAAFFLQIHTHTPKTNKVLIQQAIKTNKVHGCLVCLPHHHPILIEFIGQRYLLFILFFLLSWFACDWRLKTILV